MKRLNTFAKLRQAAKALPKSQIAVAAAADPEVLKAVIKAKEEGLAESILVGDEKEIRSLLKEEKVSADDFELVHAESPEEAAQKAVFLVHEGKAKALLKGLVPTSVLLRAVLDKERGLRGKGVMSHAMLYEHKDYDGFILNTDGGMFTFPKQEDKIRILENAANLLQALGYSSMNTAILCASETVDPKNKDSLEAEAIAAMKEHWNKWNMNIFGPVGLDLAISKEACEHKSYTAEGAGEADIILVPDFQVGNCLGKSLSYFGHADSGGLILGAAAPIMLVSRADSSKVKVNSIALAMVAANKQ